MWNRLPKALALFLALFLVIELSIQHGGYAIVLNPNTLLVQTKKRLAQDKEFRSDLLIFGDSSGAASLIANDLEKHTGHKVLDLTTFGDANMAINFFLFKRYLKSHPAPSHVAIVTTYDIWGRGLEVGKNLDVLFMHFPYEFMWDWLFAPELGKRRWAIFRQLTHLFLPSQAYKFEIRRLIESGSDWQRYLDQIYQKRVAFEEKIYRKRGRFFEPPLKDIDLQFNIDLANHLMNARHGTYSVSDLNLYYLERFIKEAKAHGVTVILESAPAYDHFYHTKPGSKYWRAFRTFLKETARNNSHVILLSDKPHLMPSHKFSSLIDHVNEDAAREFTRSFGQKLLMQMRQSHPAGQVHTNN